MVVLSCLSRYLIIDSLFLSSVSSVTVKEKYALSTQFQLELRIEFVHLVALRKQNSGKPSFVIHINKQRAYFIKNDSVTSSNWHLKCDIDNWTFSRFIKSFFGFMLNLQHHVMEEPKSSTGRDLQCPLPPSSFHHERDLDVHSHLRAKVHTRSQWSCATCDGSVLSRHVMAVHQKLTPFKCSFPSCSYPTAQRGNLRCHQRLHSTDPMTRRPFPCNFPGCDYRATLKFNLTAHIQSRHRGNRARTFGCSSCPAKFYYARHLRSHINAIHVKE